MDRRDRMWVYLNSSNQIRKIDAGGGSPSTSLKAASVNDLNQITALTGGGRMRFAGSLNEPGTVTIDGEEAYVDADDDFIGFADVSVGTNTVEIVTSDYSSNAATNNFDVVVTANGSDTVLTYDLNGNLTMTSNATEVVTYEWDAADRLVAIEQDTDRSEFTYDGLSRRVRIVEKTNSVTTSDKWFLWCNTELCEERNSAGGTVVKRFFPQGQENSGTDYYYTRDHLGSVREMVDASGTIQAQYEYDPYGKPTKVAGSLDADFGYTGHYFHEPSGLYLALFRAYSPEFGRWLSRDPLREGSPDGPNLYDYAMGNPIDQLDPTGLWTVTIGGRNKPPYLIFREEEFKKINYAILDGLIPGANPFEPLYNPCGRAEQLAHALGSFTRQVETLFLMGGVYRQIANEAGASDQARNYGKAGSRGFRCCLV